MGCWSFFVVARNKGALIEESVWMSVGQDLLLPLHGATTVGDSNLCIRVC